ncbi:hypothetical protein COLO4_32595 [Corchorus olitorius]|uniref:Uncharacterized protein n=1 Tax=Corchorus olitorius TaxID=93759 RepID=A0A1R3GYZ2_9ROSI|nr:hypothetical protein COLO4_32595 [Corchorus olitorius]
MGLGRDEDGDERVLLTVAIGNYKSKQFSNILNKNSGIPYDVKYRPYMYGS